jgi:hypothetical protein
MTKKFNQAFEISAGIFFEIIFAFIVIGIGVLLSILRI